MDPLFGDILYNKHIDRLIKLQKKLSPIVLFTDFNSHTTDLFKYLEWLSIENIIKLETIKYIYKNINDFGCTQKFFERDIRRNTDLTLKY